MAGASGGDVCRERAVVSAEQQAGDGEQSQVSREEEAAAAVVNEALVRGSDDNVTCVVSRIGIDTKRVHEKHCSTIPRSRSAMQLIAGGPHLPG